MSYSLTNNKMPDCMTRFWHANCMTSLRGHRTPLDEGLNLKKADKNLMEEKSPGF